METLDFQRNAAFHDEVAGKYDSHLYANPTNGLARRAFCELVKRHVSPGATILDFGCGTGLDALEYARSGYKVVAYDNSQGMVEQVRKRCGAEIATGRVIPYAMGYPEFLKGLPGLPRPDAITANFAVLNSIRDLPPLFSALGRHVAPGGCLIASMLNPLHWSKIKSPGWWRDILRAPRGPRLHSTRPYATYLHFIPEILRSARDFRLVGRANAGAVVRYDSPRAASVYWRDENLREGSGRSLWRTPLYKLMGHFIFLVLRRAP